MSKIELAKMLGLSATGYCQTISKHDIENLLEHEWCIISETFTSGIEVEVEQEDLSEKNLNIKHEDLVREGDIKVCVKQVEDLIWERAADEYLGKIKSLVETIKV